MTVVVDHATLGQGEKELKQWISDEERSLIFNQRVKERFKKKDS